ncbi:hypothetical protein CFC21_065010 [Triticum aestivum]|uniref:Uncharacterized protein n=3 Tax=Triticum TaxID=4564 RepID=A0A9R0TK19_TRITD|nr:hypothetical protein CFC21_065010 [Triticum aestivum]VAI15366.1 unnamed protein product [Triticum turgidum subsp. durum]
MARKQRLKATTAAQGIAVVVESQQQTDGWRAVNRRCRRCLDTAAVGQPNLTRVRNGRAVDGDPVKQCWSAAATHGGRNSRRGWQLARRRFVLDAIGDDGLMSYPRSAPARATQAWPVRRGRGGAGAQKRNRQRVQGQTRPSAAARLSTRSGILESRRRLMVAAVHGRGDSTAERPKRKFRHTGEDDQDGAPERGAESRRGFGVGVGRGGRGNRGAEAA